MAHSCTCHRLIMKFTTSLTAVLIVGAGMLSSAFTPPTRHQIPAARRNQNSLLSKEGIDATTLFEFRQRFESLFPLEFRKDDKTKKADSIIHSGKNLRSSGRSSLLLLSSALAPVADFLENSTDGWALSYADLRPESEETVIGRSFLATNLAYASVGLLLSSQGEVVLGFMTELVSIASYCYHYTQLQQPYDRTDDATVKLALLVDYFLAVSSISLGFFYLLEDKTLPSPEVMAGSAIGIGCLLACWVWEKGYPYIVLHSLWHVFSAATAYSIGVSHVSNNIST
jgi:hypothetical protein